MVAAMHMSLVQQKAACLGKSTNAKQTLSGFRAVRPAQRMVIRASSAAVAPPATGEIKEKNAELAINGEKKDGLRWEQLPTHNVSLIA
jgi:hypothetical protein